MLGAAYQALTLLACDACVQTLPATAAPFAYCFYDLANLAWSADRSGLPWAAKWEAWDWNSAKRPWANRERGFGTAEPGFGTARLARWTQAYWVSPDVQPPY